MCVEGTFAKKRCFQVLTLKFSPFGFSVSVKSFFFFLQIIGLSGISGRALQVISIFKSSQNIFNMEISIL